MRRLGWVAGGAIALVAIVALPLLWRERSDEARWKAPTRDRSTSAALLEGDPSPREGEEATRDAERGRDEATPLPAGATRFRAKFVTVGGHPLFYARVVMRPERGAEVQTLLPEPSGDARFDLDDGCGEIDIAVHGYVDVHHVVDAFERLRGDLGEIVLVPAATLDLRIVSAPRRALPWLDVTTWAATEVRREFGNQIGMGSTTVATPDGTARATFALPSDTEFWLHFNGEGIAVKPTPPPLAAGTTTWTVDLASFAKIRGRVVGVPPVCARGLVVWLKRWIPERDGLFPGMDACVDLDEQARFEFAAVPDGPFALRLDQAGLRETGGAGRETWRTEDLASGRDLELEPDRELLGVEVGPLEREHPSGGWLRFDDPAHTNATTLSRDDLRFLRGLVPASALREATRLTVDSGNGFTRVLDVASLPPPRDGVVAIVPERFPPSRGRLTVSWNWLASRDWRLELTASDRPLGEPPGPPPARRKRGLFEESFTELMPGCYDVWGSWHGTVVRRVASGIVLAPDEERRVDVKLPSPVHRFGRITNWSELDPALRPREIVFESASIASITDGRFETDVAPPLGRTARFNDARSNRIDATASIETDEDGTLAVRFPVEELELLVLTVQLPTGERAISWRLGADEPETIGLFDRRSGSSTDSNGRIKLVRKRGASLHGWIESFNSADMAKRLLTWFSSDDPLGTVVPAGRWVEVTNARDGTVATLTLVACPVGGWKPPRVPFCKVIHGLPRRIWIPDGAEFVDVEASGRALLRVECAKIGASWDVGEE